MKYQISGLKMKLNEFGVFNIKILEASNNEYANWIDLSAKQFVGSSEITHKINAITLEDALSTLLARAEAIAGSLEKINPNGFNSPDISIKNMAGHIKDGNFEVVHEAYC